MILQDSIRKKRMELIEKERKQREQVSTPLSSHHTFVIGLSLVFTLSVVCRPQAFLLRAEQMKRYEKEKVSGEHVARIMSLLRVYCGGWTGSMCCLSLCKTKLF